MSDYLRDEAEQLERSRVGLKVLHAEYAACTACSLGVLRKQTKGTYVAGGGRLRGIMFVGEGPGWMEEKEGKHFIGKAGELLRIVVKLLNIQDYYFTTTVMCRSCTQSFEDDGTPKTRKLFDGRLVPELRDSPPSAAQIESCLPRLHEEIYLVDPIVIVGVGTVAASVVAGHKVNLDQHGETMTIEVPGRNLRPKLTEKKGVWGRKVNGVFTLPVQPNMVRYTMIPSMHPAFVLRKISDKSRKSPMSEFIEDVRKAARIYEKHLEEVFGEQVEHAEAVDEQSVRRELATTNGGDNFDAAEYAADDGA